MVYRPPRWPKVLVNRRRKWVDENSLSGFLSTTVAAYCRGMVPGNGEVKVAPDARFHVEMWTGVRRFDQQQRFRSGSTVYALPPAGA